jgi:hypothetical protein
VQPPSEKLKEKFKKKERKKKKREKKRSEGEIVYNHLQYTTNHQIS